MLTIDQIHHLTGGAVYGETGDKIGSLGQIYLDDDSDQPEWATVRTGLFGMKESFVPLAGARAQDDGIVVPYDKDKIKNAPAVDPDGHLSPAEEHELFQYYGMAPMSTAYDTGTSGEQPVGYDTSASRSSDDAMTRSEERLRADTETVDAGRVRLRKHVVTGTERVDVPVRREEVRLEREPITDADRHAAHDGPAISEAEHEVVLKEERPVVATEAVPVERVRLGKQTVTDTETVAGEVRKEQIEVDDQTGGRHERDHRRD